MALGKNFTTGFGISATYWKIGVVKVDYHNKTCIVSVLGFVNKQARDEGMQQLKSKDYSFKGTDFTFNITLPLIEQIYLKIKLIPEWEGSQDV